MMHECKINTHTLPQRERSGGKTADLMWVSNKSQVTSWSSQPRRAPALWCVRTSQWRPVKQHWDRRPRRYHFPKLGTLVSFICMTEANWHNGANGRGEWRDYGRKVRRWLRRERKKGNIEPDKSSYFMTACDRTPLKGLYEECKIQLK